MAEMTSGARRLDHDVGIDLRDVEQPIHLTPVLDQRTPGAAPPRGLSGPSLVEGPAVCSPSRPGWTVVQDALRVDLTVSVVVPTFNEAMNVPAVLLQIPQEDTEVIVVDGRSSDGTIDVVSELRPDATIVHQTGRGKGDALRAGFTAASGDIIVMIDADGSMSPREIPRFVDALVSGADLAKGSRRMAGAGSSDLTIVRDVGNAGLSLLFNVLYGTRHSDLCYGYMAFWRRHLDVLLPDSDGFEVETQINVKAARAGLTVVEVPSLEGRRINGDSNLRPVRDGLRVLRAMLQGRRG